MGQLVEVLTVAVAEIAADGPLLGANIDGPVAGRAVAAGAVEIGGWALGRLEGPDEVEVALEGTPIGQVPVRHSRADIAAAFPDIAAAASAGFEAVLDLRAIPSEATLAVRARFGEAAVPIGSLHVARCWRGAWSAKEPPLVSVIVTCDGGDEEPTMSSIAAQRYGPTELLIARSSAAVDPSLDAWLQAGARLISTPGGGPAALRNEGIRSSNGALLVFVEAGRRLAGGAIERVVTALERRPEAAGLIDGAPDGEVLGAAYRRSAFEELGGFDDGSGRSCETRLAQRAAAYDLLFDPGTLIAPSGS